METILRKCTKCQKEKELKDFPLAKKSKDGIATWCRQCYTEARRRSVERIGKDIVASRVKEYNIKNPSVAIESNWRKQGINLTVTQYSEIYSKQDGKCAICGIDAKILTRKLCVDHCHNSQNIRGLLCPNCNLLLGKVKDNVIILENAIKYLKNDNSILNIGQHT